MKKLFLLLLTLLLVCTAASLAEGELTLTQENFYVVGSTTLYAYCYGRVDNMSDEPVRLYGGQLDVLGADDEVLASATYMNRLAEYLQPGEYTYFNLNATLTGVENAEDVKGYTLTLDTRETNGAVSFRLPTESAYEADVADGSWTRNYLTTTVVNDADQTVFDLTIGRALLDAEGNILYYDYDSLYDYKGLTPDSSIVLRRTMNSYLEEYITENGIVPDKVDAIAYVNLTDPEMYTRVGDSAEAPEVVEEPVPEEEPEPTEEPVPEEEPEPTEEPATEQPEANAAYAPLERGSKGDFVRILQARLKDLGYLEGSIDGDFGGMTESAVMAFQQKAGLEATGVADALTQTMLYSATAPSVGE